jgi:uncharacterized protein (TIGR02145 family)
MMKSIHVAIMLLFLAGSMFAQSVGINDDGTSPNGSAMLDVKSTTKGFLPPRMTYADRNAITGAPAGLIIWCTDCGASGELQVYNGTAWTNMVGGGASVSFVCGNLLVDSRDSKSYTTVLIGTQCWMAQNLNIGNRINGSGEQTNNSTIEKYCYNDQESNCNVYGGLYQWAEMVQYLNGATNTTSWSPVPTGNVQGFCPTGWHIPTDTEWSTLTTYLGGESVAGGKLKETGTTHWYSPNTGATNESGFTALPAGYRYADGSFIDFGSVGAWWSSSEYNADNALSRSLYYSMSDVNSYGYDKEDVGFSVRCLRDL